MANALGALFGPIGAAIGANTSIGQQINNMVTSKAATGKAIGPGGKTSSSVFTSAPTSRTDAGFTSAPTSRTDAGSEMSSLLSSSGSGVTGNLGDELRKKRAETYSNKWRG